jgi:large subunit ribosomal protein L35
MGHIQDYLYLHMKTHKAMAKRFKITKTGKVLKRTAGQDHFNSRESGKVKRNKRRDKEMSESYTKTIKQLTQQ